MHPTTSILILVLYLYNTHANQITKKNRFAGATSLILTIKSIIFVKISEKRTILTILGLFFSNYFLYGRDDTTYTRILQIAQKVEFTSYGQSPRGSPPLSHDREFCISPVVAHILLW